MAAMYGTHILVCGEGYGTFCKLRPHIPLSFCLLFSIISQTVFLKLKMSFVYGSGHRLLRIFLVCDTMARFVEPTQVMTKLRKLSKNRMDA